MEDTLILHILNFAAALLLAPLLPGIINRVKAVAGGRHGKPFLQLYYDLGKLLKKDLVYPACSTWIFYTGPILSLAASILAVSMLPFAGSTALFSFTGDFLLIAYLFAMARFVTMLGALDTGSAFEGMGASREATFSAIAEPVFLLSFLPMGFLAGSFSLSTMISPFHGANWLQHWPVLLLLSIAFLLIALVENCRIPADDPNTHLELTMIHEVMILDHGGPDLALIEYASALKLWFFAVVISNLALPPLESYLYSYLIGLGGILAVAVSIGVIESVVARLRLLRVPQLLAMAGALSALACVLCFYKF